MSKQCQNNVKKLSKSCQKVVKKLEKQENLKEEATKNRRVLVL
jgi:hypothetical protein